MKDMHVSEDSEGMVVTLNLNFCVPPFSCRDLRGVLIPDYLLNVGLPVSVYRNQCETFLFSSYQTEIDREIREKKTERIKVNQS